MSKIGINGFGRVGRSLFRAAVKRKIPIGGINDPFMTPQIMAYLLKYDTTQGRFRGKMCVKGNCLIVNGNTVPLSYGKCPASIAWKDMGVGYVAECSGKYTTLKGVCSHIKQGAKKVVISAPSKDLPMFIRGINMECAKSDVTMMSIGSDASNALAPLAKVLHESFGITEGYMTTIHAVEANQPIIDNLMPKSWRIGRGGMLNAIPYNTDAAKTVSEMIDGLKCKLDGIGFYVPIRNVSAIDFTVRLKKATTMEKIRKKMKAASKKSLKGVLGYTEDQVVSSDFIGSPESTIFDAKASMGLGKNFFKIISWYDNEYATANRMLDLLKQISKKKKAKKCKPKKKKC